MAATIEQAVQVLQLQLSEANAQIGLMSTALDALRMESVAAVQELCRQLAATAATATAQGGRTKEVNFINTKTFEGGKFSGTDFLGLLAFWSMRYLRSRST